MCLNLPAELMEVRVWGIDFAWARSFVSEKLPLPNFL